MRKESSTLQKCKRQMATLGFDSQLAYHRVKLILKIYRDVVWVLSERVEELHEYAWELGAQDADTGLIYLQSFAPDMELMPMAQAPALGEVVSNTSAKERQHKCEVLISEAMGIASVQNPFTDRNMPYEQPFQPDAGDAEAVPIFVILSPIC